MFADRSRVRQLLWPPRPPGAAAVEPPPLALLGISLLFLAEQLRLCMLKTSPAWPRAPPLQGHLNAMPRPLQMALLLALVLRASLAAAFALPPWAKPLPGGRPIRVAYARRNKRTVAAENAAYQRPDVAIYGDSITAGERADHCFRATCRRRSALQAVHQGRTVTGPTDGS